MAAGDPKALELVCQIAAEDGVEIADPKLHGRIDALCAQQLMEWHTSITLNPPVTSDLAGPDRNAALAARLKPFSQDRSFLADVARAVAEPVADQPQPLTSPVLVRAWKNTQADEIDQAVRIALAERFAKTANDDARLAHDLGADDIRAINILARAKIAVPRVRRVRSLFQMPTLPRVSGR